MPISVGTTSRVSDRSLEKAPYFSPPFQLEINDLKYVSGMKHSVTNRNCGKLRTRARGSDDEKMAKIETPFPLMTHLSRETRISRGGT